VGSGRADVAVGGEEGVEGGFGRGVEGVDFDFVGEEEEVDANFVDS
jgi:hypothetical protein